MPEHYPEAVAGRPPERAPAPGAHRLPGPATDRAGDALARFEVQRFGAATLIRGDALEVLDALAPGSIGAVLTDPPYSSGGTTIGERQRPTAQKYVQSELRHSGRLSSAEFVGDNRDQRSFLAWSHLWMGRARAAVAPGGLIGVFADWRQLPITTDAVQVAGWVWRGIVPWDKTEAVRPVLGRYRAQAEYVVWGSNGPRPLLGAVAPGVVRERRPAVKMHMCGKPVGIMRDLLRVMSGPVLDPFMGSSPIGEACAQLGLPYIGVEFDPGHFDTACRRLEALSADTSRPPPGPGLAPAGARAA